MSLKIEKKGDVFFLIGNLNEKADLSALITVPEKIVKLDVSQMEHTNSVGIQTFINCLVQWEGKSWEYHGCHPEFADQLDMIPKLLKPDGEVKSLFYRFFCPNCESKATFKVGSEDLYQWAKNDAYPSRKCAECGYEGVFEPEEPPEYLWLGLDDS